MLGALPHKTKEFFFLLIKLSIVFGAAYFIYNKLANNPNLDFKVFIDFTSKNSVFSTKNIIYLVILTIFNWFFEILKWQNLVSVIKNISFFEALKQSLASLTASLFTPNRIGEYGAKALYFSSSRKKVMLLNLISNMSQMLITTILGGIGLIVFSSKYEINIDSFKILRILVLGFMIISLTVFGVRRNKIKIRGFDFSKIIDFIKSISRIVITKTFVFSLTRYLIFSFQFYYLLTIFGIDVYYINAMIVISSMYLLSSIIPSIFIFDVIVKGSVALYLFNIVGVNDLTILSIITIMWLLNFVLPSIVGSAFVMSFNYKNTFKTN
jgi:uncharacterized membrane protein YbhN (UPF0104 family)